MKIYALFTVLIFTLFSHQAAYSQIHESATQSENHLDLLFQRLDSSRYAERRMATNELIKLGAKNLEKIYQGQKVDSCEARTRCEEIEKEIFRPHANSSTYVTYRGTNSVRNILDEVSSQTGNAIPVGEIFDDSVISLSVNNLSFWNTLLLISSNSGNSICSAPNNWGWEIREAPHNDSWFSVDGPALAKRSSTYELWTSDIIKLINEMDAAGNLRQKYVLTNCAIGIHFNIFYEPSFKVHSAWAQATEAIAITENRVSRRRVLNRENKEVPLLNSKIRDHKTLVCVEQPLGEPEFFRTLVFEVSCNSLCNSVRFEIQKESNEFSGDSVVFGKQLMVKNSFQSEDFTIVDFSVINSRSGSVELVSNRDTLIDFSEADTLEKDSEDGEVTPIKKSRFKLMKSETLDKLGFTIHHLEFPVTHRFEFHNFK